jgi:phage shock protein PspC (stress-responsive transcriptional regulator)
MSFFVLMAKFHIYLSNLMYLIVASTAPSAEDAQDLLSVGLIIEGLLGGFASYNGAVHALVRQSRLLQSLTLLQVCF